MTAEQVSQIFAPKPVGDRTILYVMAVDNEYGDHLKARFTPLFTGVGPVEAAIALTRTLTALEAAGQLPDYVVSLGSAGSRTLAQGEIYQASSVSYRDMDASPLGFAKGETPFLNLPAELDLTIQIPDVPSARLSTGANIVSGKAYDLIDADMVDMESFAALRTCQQFNLPLIALRGISDGADELKTLTDWTQYLHVVDENLAGVVDKLEGAVKAGAI